MSLEVVKNFFKKRNTNNELWLLTQHLWSTNYVPGTITGTSVNNKEYARALRSYQTHG